MLIDAPSSHCAFPPLSVCQCIIIYVNMYALWLLSKSEYLQIESPNQLYWLGKFFLCCFLCEEKYSSLLIYVLPKKVSAISLSPQMFIRDASHKDPNVINKLIYSLASQIDSKRNSINAAGHCVLVPHLLDESGNVSLNFPTICFTSHLSFKNKILTVQIVESGYTQNQQTEGSIHRGGKKKFFLHILERLQ